MAQSILITGASGGFGSLTTKALLAKGHTVIASMRNPESAGKAAAQELSTLGAHVIALDVTDEASVTKGVAEAIDHAGGTLDVVINNAGVGVLGYQEAFTAEDWQKLFDVNVFGVQRVNRAVVPHMRERRAGLLVHISSLLGRMVMPAYGPYNASKWAVEALAEGYRVELGQLGIDSCVVEPGGFPTTFIDNLMRPSDAARSEGYGDMAAFPEMFLQNFEKALAGNPAQNPENVADALVTLIETPQGERPFRTVVDAMGMGTHIGPYNEMLEKIMQGVYGAYGLGHLLTVKK